MKPRASLFLALSLLLMLAACGEKIRPGTTKISRPQLKGLKLATAAAISRPLPYEAVGTVRAGITSHLASKLQAVIKHVAVREGDRVRSGQILVALDQRQVNARFRQARAALAEAKEALAAASSGRDAAEAAAEVARATYQRYLQLKRADSVSPQEFDEVQARYRRAQAARQQAEAMLSAASSRVRRAEAALAAARATRTDSLITAPHAGIITAKLVDRGDLALPGKHLLTLESDRAYRVDVVLPEKYIGYLRLQQQVLVAVPALRPSLLQGRVSTIVPAADPASRTFLVKVALPPATPVKSGMFARIRIPLGQQRLLLVPRSALVSRGQLSGLLIVDAEGIAHFRLVRLGRVFGDSVEVLSGLKQGDHFVVKPPPELIDGARVEAAS